MRKYPGSRSIQRVVSQRTDVRIRPEVAGTTGRGVESERISGSGNGMEWTVMSLVACALIAGFVFGLLLLRVVAVLLDSRDVRRVQVPVRSRHRPHRR